MRGAAIRVDGVSMVDWLNSRNNIDYSGKTTSGRYEKLSTLVANRLMAERTEGLGVRS